MDRVLSYLELADELMRMKRDVERSWLPESHARLLGQAIFKLRHTSAAEDAEERQNAGGTREASGCPVGDSGGLSADTPLDARVEALAMTVADLASRLQRLQWFVAGERMSGEVDDDVKDAQRRADATVAELLARGIRPFGKDVVVRRSAWWMEKRSGVERRKSKAEKRSGVERRKWNGA